MKGLKFWILLLVAVTAGLFLFWQLSDFDAELYLLVEPSPNFSFVKIDEPVVGVTPLPDQVNINVPFTSQAPFEIWDDIHKEACEEAAVLQAASFWLGQDSLTKQEAEDQLQVLVAFEIDKFGYFEDTDTLETAQLILDYYDFKGVDVAYDFDIGQIKKELADGYPVIVPTAGRMLGNPYFQTPGPIYHMLVVIGYEDNQFITNDNGTKRGEQYRYDQEVLFEAIHDWNDGDIENGRKAMIVIRN